LLMGITQILKGIAGHPLNRQARFKAIWKFIRWQIGSRILPGPVLIDFVNDAKLLVARGMTGATGNLYNGLHEFEDMAFLLHFLRKEDVFVDIGANVGSYTVLASGAVGARTISFEPIPLAFIWLKRNVAVNGVAELVKLYNMGVASKRGRLLFAADKDTTNHVILNQSLEDHGDKIQVEVDTLDMLLKGESPTLLKIDTEGFEMEVLSGASGILDSQDTLAVIMEINGSGFRYGHSDAQLLQEMKKYHFQTCRYDPFTRTLLPLNGRASGSGNTLFVKNVELVSERLAGAVPFLVRGISL